MGSWEPECTTEAWGGTTGLGVVHHLLGGKNKTKKQAKGLQDNSLYFTRVE